MDREGDVESGLSVKEVFTAFSLEGMRMLDTLRRR